MPAPHLPYGSLSDVELFNLIRQEKTGAFDFMYRQYWPVLTTAACRKLQSRQQAEDLVQDIFLSLYQKKAALRITVSLKAYLNKALQFKMLNTFRSDAVRAGYARSLFLSPVCKNDFVDELEARELGRQVKRLQEQLPGKCREVFRLSRQEARSNPEIARALNLSVSTVEKHIVKALKILRQQLPAGTV